MYLQYWALEGNADKATLYSDRVLRFTGSMCVLSVEDLLLLIHSEAHGSTYSSLSGTENMYRDLR